MVVLQNLWISPVLVKFHGSCRLFFSNFVHLQGKKIFCNSTAVNWWLILTDIDCSCWFFNMIYTFIKWLLLDIHIRSPLLLFPVDRDTCEFFAAFQRNIFEFVSNQPCGILKCTTSWLFCTMLYSFTTCLSSRRKLTAVFVRHRTVGIGAVYQLKIKYDQNKFEGFFLRKTPSKLSPWG